MQYSNGIKSIFSFLPALPKASKLKRGKRKAMRKVNRDQKEFKQSVLILEKDYRDLNDAYQNQGGNILLQWAKVPSLIDSLLPFQTCCWIIRFAITNIFFLSVYLWTAWCPCFIFLDSSHHPLRPPPSVQSTPCFKFLECLLWSCFKGTRIWTPVLWNFCLLHAPLRDQGSWKWTK